MCLISLTSTNAGALLSVCLRKSEHIGMYDHLYLLRVVTCGSAFVRRWVIVSVKLSEDDLLSVLERVCSGKEAFQK